MLLGPVVPLCADTGVAGKYATTDRTVADKTMDESRLDSRLAGLRCADGSIGLYEVWGCFEL